MKFKGGLRVAFFRLGVLNLRDFVALAGFAMATAH
jgi:hypothetical protein